MDKSNSDLLHKADWSDLLKRLLPNHLPTNTSECTSLLTSLFRYSIPAGTIYAISLLVSLDHEKEALDLLLDFLQEKHDSAKLHKRIRMKLHFKERTTKHSVLSQTQNNIEAQPNQFTGQHSDYSAEHWDWIPENVSPPLTIDDQALRTEAFVAQEAIGSYSHVEEGVSVFGFSELERESSWEKDYPQKAKDRALSMTDRALLERTAKLSKVALDLLRYFATNPRDKAFHAESVLGYPCSEINKILTGSLRPYLRKNPNGGWECLHFVSELLEVLDQNT